MHVTPAAISHQIKALEEYLGIQLFRRLTRSLALTPEGQAMLAPLAQGFESLARAVEGARRPETGESLTVSAPPAFASRWLVPRLHRFAAAHPQVELRLTGTLDTVDQEGSGPGEDERPGTLEDNCDVGIRFGNGRYPGFRVEPIIAPSIVPACSPRLLQGTQPLRTPLDLRHHALLHDDTVQNEANGPNWEEWLRKAGATEVDPSRGLRFNNAVLAIEAAVDGLGVVLALKPLIQSDVAAGRLVIPFGLDIPSRYAYYLVTSRTAAIRRSTSQFREWLLSEVRLAA
jgi:LysR family glycine cleavage system transcriptional activator